MKTISVLGTSSFARIYSPKVGDYFYLDISYVFSKSPDFGIILTFLQTHIGALHMLPTPSANRKSYT